MNPAKVYYTDLRTRDGDNLPKKLQRLIRAAGIADIDMEKKFVAIKLHFGEPGNLSFLRPNYAKAVADVVKELGGIPFLTDCNTLYVGRRKHALEHLEAAQENGFSPLSTGCQIIIADGLVSLVAELADDHHTRSFKITRKPASEAEYEDSLITKYNMTENQMKAVIGHED